MHSISGRREYVATANRFIKSKECLVTVSIDTRLNLVIKGFKQDMVYIL